MSTEEQKARVLEHLQRRERIASQTREQLEAREKRQDTDPLADVDAEVRRAAEDEFYAAQGRRRYTTSDGRTMFLTPEQIAHRRRGRAQRASGRKRKRGRYFGVADTDRRRQLITWGFNASVVALALIVVWLILS